MNYSKYYTPSNISEFLVNDISVEKPNNIIDICCGSYNLLNAAKKKWEHIEVVGVDINSQLKEKYKLRIMDGRQYAIKSKDKYDIVLANPPFRKMSKKREFSDLYVKPFDKYVTNRLENEMLLANLKLLSRNAVLMIILPSTFVEGDTNLNLRKIIANNYVVSKIVKLPNDTFGNSKVHTYSIYIVNKKRKSYYTQWIDISNNSHRIIDHQQISNGIWNAYAPPSNTKNIKPTVIRGKISSNMFTNRGIAVLHSNKKLENISWVPSIKKVPMHIINESSYIYADDGDIVINRIGKSSGYWNKYRGDRIMISDCLLVVKDTNGSIYELIKNVYQLPLTKGVTVQYITVNDFINWYSSLS